MTLRDTSWNPDRSDGRPRIHRRRAGRSVVLSLLLLGGIASMVAAPLAASDQPAAKASSASAPNAATAPIFRFTTDGFWLNLHHFLYVLGRAEAGTRDSERRAVRNAPGDQARGLAGVSAERQAQWREAVTVYAQGPSQLQATHDEALFNVTAALVGVGESLDGVDIDPAWAAALEQAAPLYRAIWWPEHRDANRAWVAALEPLLAEHGASVLAFITRATGLPWPRDGFPIQVSGYCNWAGAYSTRHQLLVISSLDEDLRGTSLGMEVAFHEAMHQWDDVQFAMLVAAATARNVRFSGGLDHAMLFFTIGEAMRAVVPEHIPYAQTYGIWERRSGEFLPMLETAWRPYLHGLVGREHALTELMRHFEKPRDDGRNALPLAGGVSQ